MTENGERLVELCIKFKFVLAGTLFPHKNIHIITWVCPDDITETLRSPINLSPTKY